MYGAAILKSISDLASVAADLYPQLLRLMDAAGVPPDQRAAVLAYIMQVVDSDQSAAGYLQ